MKTYSMFFLCLMMLLGLNSLSSAAIVNDPAGDTIAGGPTDITAVQAAQLMRVDGYALLKLSLTATPNIGGIVIFEADVDGSIGTGTGGIEMQFVPIVPPPCPCKTVAGIDVAVTMINRMQGANSSSAMCEGCVETTSTAISCGKRRWPGEWYAAATSLPHDSTGVIRGFSDPQPIYTTTSKCYTLPWDAILVYVRTAITNPENQYDYSKALDPATTRWQVSVWTDPNYAADEDDFANGTTLLNISDVVPNGDGILVNGVDNANATPLTFCEGNFDGDQDVDGSDAAIFRLDFGRSAFCGSNFGSSACTVCPRCGPYY